MALYEVFSLPSNWSGLEYFTLLLQLEGNRFYSQLRPFGRYWLCCLSLCPFGRTLNLRSPSIWTETVFTFWIILYPPSIWPEGSIHNLCFASIWTLTTLTFHQIWCRAIYHIKFPSKWTETIFASAKFGGTDFFTLPLRLECDRISSHPFGVKLLLFHNSEKNLPHIKQ